MTSLNPVHTVGAQICESLRIHLGMSARAATDRAAELLNQVGISDPKRRLTNYPHELSGGMRQRVMIAMAIACEPSLLIADEPTTALDVTIQARILQLLKELQAASGMSVLFITHDLGVVAEIAHRVVVMYGAQVVEEAAVEALFAAPRHPYTAGLLRAMPQVALERGHDPVAIPGTVAQAHAWPDGCRFNPRCDYRQEGTCTTVAVPLARDDHGLVRCARAAALRNVLTEAVAA